MQASFTRRVCPEWLANRLFFLCAITYIIALFGRLSYAAVMAEVIVSEGLTKGEAGLIGTALFASYGVCQVISGFVGDKISPRRMITFGVVGSGVLNLSMGASSGLPLMLVCWTLNGAFQSCIWSPIARVFAEIMPPTHRLRACANIGVAYPLATILTYLAASLLVHITSWRVVFFLSGGLMLLITLWWERGMHRVERMTALRGPMETIELSEAESAHAGSLWRVLLVSGAVCAIFGALTGGMLRDGIQSWVPSFLTERFGLATALSILLAILLPVVNVFGVFLTKYLARRYIRNEMWGAVGFYAVCILFLALLVPASGASATLSLLLMTAASTAMVGANTMFVSFMPIHFGAIGKSSSVTGVINCATYAGSALSAYGIGHVAEAFGWEVAILTWLGFAVVALLTTALGAGRWGRYRRNIL